MQSPKSIFTVLIISILLVAGCTTTNNTTTLENQNIPEQNELITVTGTAEETKDGYYIGAYVLTHEEIKKYDTDYIWSEYSGKNVTVIGKEKTVNVECEPYAQCREGSYKLLYDIESIKIL